MPAGHQGQPGRPAHVVERGQLAGLQDHLEVGASAGLPDGDDLLEHLQVAAGQERAPVDDHVDLVGAGLYRLPDVPSLTARLARPDGNAVATLATFTVEPASSAFATPTRSG